MKKNKIIYLDPSNSSSLKEFDQFSYSSEHTKQSEFGFKEVAATSNESGDHMDDSTKMMLERLERDSRERESRYHADAKEREQRFNELTKEMRQENRDRENRIYNDLKEREDRIFKALEESNARIEKSLDEVNKSVLKAEDSISTTAKHVQSMVSQNFWGRIGAIVAALAICATVGATIWAAFRSS